MDDGVNTLNFQINTSLVIFQNKSCLIVNYNFSDRFFTVP